MHQFSEQDVVVINGAAGGIGTATVRAFLDAGATVVGIDRSPAVTHLAGSRYTGYCVDLLDVEAVRAAVADAESTAPIGSALRAVVGIAGGADAREITAEHFSLTDPAAIQDVITANYVNQHTFAQTVWPWLARSGPHDRSVTFTGSINGSAGYRMPAYAAAKLALVGLTRSLAGTEGPLGIRVNVLSPGAVRTQWWRSRPESEWPELRRQQELSETELAAAIPLRRVAEPEDVAQAYVWLAAQRHLTGEEVRLDGGQFLQQSLLDALDPEHPLDMRAERFVRHAARTGPART